MLKFLFLEMNIDVDYKSRRSAKRRGCIHTRSMPSPSTFLGCICGEVSRVTRLVRNEEGFRLVRLI